MRARGHFSVEGDRAIIAVTHSEGFAEKADHVVRLEKEGGTSKVIVER